MVGTLGNTDMDEREREKAWVISTAHFLGELKAEDLKVLDMRKLSGIVDYFLIATVNSYAQLKGLVNNLKAFFAEQGIPCKSSGKHLSEDIWTLLDCEYFVVHLMTREARAFYALEKLWFEAEQLEISTEES